MSSVLDAISNELADAVATIAPAVVQVQGGRRPGGRLIGVPTATAIRGLGVVIPARIAWATAAASQGDTFEEPLTHREIEVLELLAEGLARRPRARHHPFG